MRNQNRILPILLAALVLVGGLSGCGKGNVGKGNAKAEVAINSRLEAIRQAGQPVTLAELNAWYTEPPAAENAAPLYVDAFAALVVEDAKSPFFLAKNQPALALFHKAAARTRCRYALELTQGGSVALPHLSKIKTGAQLLGREAVAAAGKGRPDQAAQAVIDGLRLARSLEQEPLLISQLVRISSDSLAQASLQEALTLKAFPEAQLARLQAALREEEGALGAGLARAFAGEQCNTIHFFQMPAAEYQNYCQSAGANAPFGASAEFEQYRKGAAFAADFNLCLDCFSNWLAIAAMPYPACLDAAGQWAPEASARINEAKTKGCRISAVVLPTLDSTFQRVADCVGHLRAAQAAVAAERYRLASSFALPDNLKQLVPTYLTAVPEDPYDGKPLRYKKCSPKGYVVYSIGRNRQDDGGTPVPAGGKADGAYDLTFVVNR